MEDPEFLAEAQRLKIDIELVSVEDLTDLTQQLYATPPDVIAHMVSILGSRTK